MPYCKLIGILGGTFDPIHHGHLQAGKYLLNKLKLEKVLFIPCYKPPHAKQPIVSAQHRFNMVKLAIETYKKFSVSDCEIKRQGSSYTIDTLQELRLSYPNNSLCLLLGKDVFIQLNTWHQWQKILDLAHIVVIERGKVSLPNEAWVKEILNTHQVKNLLELQQYHYGKIYFIQQPVSPLSATEVRHKLCNKEDVSEDVPKNVLDYISQHHLYTAF